MKTVFFNFSPLSKPATISTELSHTPIIICNNRSMLVYKNKAASSIGFKRLGSNVTKHLSADQRKLLQNNDFESHPCICLAVKMDEDLLLWGYVCRCPAAADCTLWIFPLLSQYTDEGIRRSLINFFPMMIDRLTTEPPKTKWYEDDPGHGLINKAVFCALNNLSSNISEDCLGYSQFAATVKKFTSSDLSSAGYKITVNCEKYQGSELMIPNANIILCSFFAALLAIAEKKTARSTKARQQSNINLSVSQGKLMLDATLFYKECDSLTVIPRDEHGLIIDKHSISLDLIRHIFYVSGIEYSLTGVKKDNGFLYNLVIKSDVVSPSSLISDISDSQFDDMYNKFIYFLKDI